MVYLLFGYLPPKYRRLLTIINLDTYWIRFIYIDSYSRFYKCNINILAPYSNQNLEIDIGCDYGSSVFSVDNGLVLEAGYKDKLGNYVIIKTDSIDPITGKSLLLGIPIYKAFLSLSKQEVDKGTTEIGKSDATGLTTVPKLHIDINNAEVTADNLSKRIKYPWSEKVLDGFRVGGINVKKSFLK